MRSALQSFEQLPVRPTLDQPIQPDPTLPLWRLHYEDDRTDLPGIGCISYSGRTEADGTRIWTRGIKCYCGREFTADGSSPVVAEDAVMAQLLAHASTHAPTALVPCERCDYIGPHSQPHDRWTGSGWVQCSAALLATA